MPAIFTIRVNLSVNTVHVDKTWRYNLDKTVQEVNILGLQRVIIDRLNSEYTVYICRSWIQEINRVKLLVQWI